jgi:hypothetical protein
MYPIGLKYMRVDQLTAEILVNQIAKVLQSNKKLTLDNNLLFTTTIIEDPAGRGKRLEDFIIKKQSIVSVKDADDSLCGLRAIILGKLFADGDPRFKTARDSRNKLQTHLAYELANKMGLSDNNTVGIDEIISIEKYLQDYQIFLIDSNCLNKIIYIGPTKTKHIYIYLHNNHYYMVKSLTGFYTSKNFCFVCLQAYSSSYVHHPCNDSCKKCKNKLCIKKGTTVFFKCESCDVNCVNEVCLALHQERVCGKIQKCLICNEFKTFYHSCTGKWCKFCKKEVNFDHKCFILREDEKDIKTRAFEGYIYFDYEAMQVNNIHVPNLVIAKKSLCLLLK